MKPFLSRRLQLWLRRKVAIAKRARCANVWPILEKAGEPPKGWPGWPENKQFAVILTHDVELSGGQHKVRKLAQIEKKMGFRSSFNFVPERYDVSAELRQYLEEEGFEVGVHGLNHDGKLFQNREVFQDRAKKINQYIKEWGAVGFRSPAMHHNLEWIHDLELEYDLSTFDSDPFEPQADGVETIFPFWVSKNGGTTGYVELPYTLAQDFTPFILMREKNIEIWKQKVDWIAKKGGMVLVNTHPDYMSFNGETPGLEEFPVQLYIELLEYIKTEYESRYWLALPRETARFTANLSEQSEKGAL